MRKSFLLAFCMLLIINNSRSQHSVSKIAHNYFRSDPFSGEFSSFLTHLLNDPTLTATILERRTDSSLFYFQGTYKNFNPFFFKPKRVQVVLTELPVDLDSAWRDTIYSYQIYAYGHDTEEGMREIKKEFEKIFKRFKNLFKSNELTENQAGSKYAGATYNLFDGFHNVAPFAISWFGPTEDHEMGLVLTIRMDNSFNQAILPVPFYAPK